MVSAGVGLAVAPAADSALLSLGWIVAVGGVAVLLMFGLYLLASGQSWAEHRAGLLFGLRGLLDKELRTRSRGWRPVVVLTIYLGLLTLGVSVFLAVAGSYGTVPPTIGLILFSILSTGSVLLLSFLTPALTTGAISGERERRTLDLLLVTRASALGLIVGKLLGSLLYILFLLVVALPFFAVVYLFGGVPPVLLAAVLAVAAVTATSYAALGLLFSAILRRTLVATVAAYLCVGLLVFGLPLIGAITTLTRSGTVTALAWYLNASPLTSLGSVLPTENSGVSEILLMGATGSSGSFGMPRPSAPSFTKRVYVVGVNPQTSEPRFQTAWAPWVYHFTLSGLLTLLCVFWSALVLSPARPGQALRLRRRAAPPPTRPRPETMQAGTMRTEAR